MVKWPPWRQARGEFEVSSSTKKVLNTTLVLTVLWIAGCMKPLTNGQTVIDPSDAAADPSGVYSPKVLAPEWRDQMSPKVPSGMETVTKDLAGTPRAQSQVTIRPMVQAPTGRQTVTAPTGTPRRAFKALPRPETAGVAAATGKRAVSPVPATMPRENLKEPVHSLRIPNGRDIETGGIITPTIYFVPVIDEDAASCDDKVGMHLMDGSVRMRLCRRSASFCSEQGSCLIKKNGKWVTLNIIKRVAGIDRYKEINDGCVYGYGVRNICLDPYYSVAADLSVYSPGDVVFIPKIRGTLLPNGQRHDGYFIVRDQGRGVKGQGRFDFFTGGESWSNSANPFVKAQLNDKETDMSFQKITGELAAHIKAQRAFPKLPVRAGTAQVAQYSGNTQGTPTSPLAEPGSDHMSCAASR